MILHCGCYILIIHSWPATGSPLNKITAAVVHLINLFYESYTFLKNSFLVLTSLMRMRVIGDGGCRSSIHFRILFINFSFFLNKFNFFSKTKLFCCFLYIMQFFIVLNNIFIFKHSLVLGCNCNTTMPSCSLFILQFKSAFLHAPPFVPHRHRRRPRVCLFYYWLLVFDEFFSIFICPLTIGMK